MDDNIIRIMITTDNHLGYLDKDLIRCDDSFAAFEEVLEKCKSSHADMLLLAGDLFHENKPSRRTMHRTIDLFRKYCLGEESIYMTCLNSPGDIINHEYGNMNYENPYLSISLPVVSIHGNHDDPTKDGVKGEPLAALDLLSACNLVNYIGKNDNLEEIEVKPLLFKKEDCFVAIYGVGNIRDERMNRLWKSKKFLFVQPTEEQGRSKFHCILVIHQNRDYGRGSKNCIHESMIPEWMDVVIWGNEHEAKPCLLDSLMGTYRIYQPGSSIATSLNSGESSKHPKSFGLLELKWSDGKKMRLIPNKFTQIRPFIYDEMSLQQEGGLDPGDPRVEDKMKQVITRKIKRMIDEAKEDSHIAADANINTEFKLKDPGLVLVRLKVDIQGFPSFSLTRFAQQFVGVVANEDILIFSKKRAANERATETERGSHRTELFDAFEKGDEDAINLIKVEDLVNETINSSNKKLGILDENAMATALSDFVNKKENAAIIDTVNDILENWQDILKKKIDEKEDVEFDFKEEAAKIKSDIEKAQKKDGNFIVRKDRSKERTKEYDLDDDDDYDEDDDAKKSKAKGKKTTKEAKPKATKAPAKPRGKAATSSSSSKASQKEVVTSTRAKRTTAKKSYAEDDDDDDAYAVVDDDESKGSRDSVVDLVDDDDDDDDNIRSSKSKPKAKPAAKTTAKKTVSKRQEYDDDDDVDNEDDEWKASSSVSSQKRSQQSLTGRSEAVDATPTPLSPSKSGKRQLPLSFAAKASGTQSSPKKASKKAMEWD